MTLYLFYYIVFNNGPKGMFQTPLHQIFSDSANTAKYKHAGNTSRGSQVKNKHSFRTTSTLASVS